MNDAVLPRSIELLGWSFSEAIPTTLGVSLFLVALAVIIRRRPGLREAAEAVYEMVERSIKSSVSPEVDARPVVPLILTLWLFIGATNLVGLLPGLRSPTADLATACALALLSLSAGHVLAIRAGGMASFRRFLEPHPLMLPFNIVGELSRTLALALRLFGNMLSGQLIGAIVLYLAGLLVPVPLLLLGVLTAVVQAYIFGVLTLVFTAGGLEAAGRRARLHPEEEPS